MSRRNQGTRKSGQLVETLERKPNVPVVVVVYNMPREAPRTLHSLSAEYQRQIDADDYEVIVVDNGSNPPFDPKVIEGLSGNFRLIRMDRAPPSPAQAINRGLAEARGDIIGVMIDGARIVTPGLLHFARHGARLDDKAVVATLGWYLGHDLQGGRCSVDTTRLARMPCSTPSIDRMTAIACLKSARWTNPQWMVGGTNTNASPERQRDNLLGWCNQYAAIRGRDFQPLRPRHAPKYVGTLPQPALARMVRAAIHPAARHFEQPLGADFSKELWQRPPLARSGDKTIDGLVGLAENEFRHGRFEASCAVARLICERAPDEEPHQHLLSLVGYSVPLGGPAESQRVDYHLALAEAHRILDESDSAAANYRAALTFNPDLLQAHLGLAALRLPGDDYLVWLERLYLALAPETVVEIGVFQGASLALMRPPTVAIGIDPSPTLVSPPPMNNVPSPAFRRTSLVSACRGSKELPAHQKGAVRRTNEPPPQTISRVSFY